MGGNLAQMWSESGNVLAALFGFGVVYAVCVHVARHHGWLDGYTWLAVVVGVSVNLLAGEYMSATPLEMFVLFACSGAPMAAGDIIDYVRRRKRERADANAALERIIGGCG